MREVRLDRVAPAETIEMADRQMKLAQLDGCFGLAEYLAREVIAVLF